MTLCEKIETNNALCLNITDTMQKEESKQENCFKKIEENFVNIAATYRSCLRELRELQASCETRATRQNNINNRVLAELRNIVKMLYPDNSQEQQETPSWSDQVETEKQEISRPRTPGETPMRLKR